MGLIISFVSIKGGVGKTTLAIETASALANNFGKRVLLVDANFSAPNLDLYLDLTPDLSLHDVLDGEALHASIYEAHGIDIIPASMYYGKDVDIFQLKRVLSKMKNRYDFIIMDSSPHYSELLPVIVASDKIFVVTTPDSVTLETSLKAARMAKAKKTPVEGVIINRIRNPKYEADLDYVEDFFDIPVIARVRDDKNMVKVVYLKKPMTIHNPKSHVSREIRRLSSALCGESEGSSGILNQFLHFNGVSKDQVNRELLRKKFYEEQLR